MINKKDVIEIKDGVIPYEKIKDQKDIKDWRRYIE